MTRVLVRMWTDDGYHKDVACLSDKQVHMTYGNMDVKSRHLLYPMGPRVVINPKDFPEAVEFEVIVETNKE